MGYVRFFRRQQIAPGVRVNLSKSGASLSLGHRGTWFTMGPRGRRTTIGAPGTGLYYTWRSARRGNTHRSRSTLLALGALVIGLARILFWTAALIGVAVAVSYIRLQTAIRRK